MSSIPEASSASTMFSKKPDSSSVEGNGSDKDKKSSKSKSLKKLQVCCICKAWCILALNLLVPNILIAAFNVE